MLVMVAATLAGCAVAPPTPVGPRPPPPDPARASEVVLRAMSLIGVDYRWGGSTVDTGLDCSGLVRLVFMNAADIQLPRRAEEQQRRGATVPSQWLEPGDLVFFNTSGRPYSHVGIFVGDDRFVHAPRTGGKVRLERLGTGYWATRFDGGRRLLTTRSLREAADASQ